MTNTTDLQRMGQEFDLMPRDEVISLLRRLVNAGEDARINRTPMVPLHKLTVASILALLEDSGWLPIETAPRDGAFWVATAFTGHGSGFMEPVRPAIGFKGKLVNIYTDRMIEWTPTHWMPLPTAPNQQTESM